MVLDCGAGNGHAFDILSQRCGLSSGQYIGIEWDQASAASGRDRGLDILCHDLNEGIPQKGESFSCVYALSVLEHLLNPCRFIQESHHVLKGGGRLVLLTPNISTYFTAALILMGKMPSSGPHPDSDVLIKKEELFKVSSESLKPDSEFDTPRHRHLVVFSYRVLKKYLRMVGFVNVEGSGFGLYPFPVFTQPLLEKIDPYHCHQMMFVAEKNADRSSGVR
jgi:SAM-dependent methyltransferase